jgi:Ca-activated chloride channel family protein
LRTRIEPEGIAIVMLLDVSGSMAERDFDWDGQQISRLEAVKRCFRLFVQGSKAIEASDGVDLAGFEGRPTDSIGLVTFATRSQTACPPTLSHSVLLRLLDEEQARKTPTESETNISDGIVRALGRLKDAGDRRKVIVLLSDGEHNIPRPPSGMLPTRVTRVAKEETPSAARVAAGLRVPIYTIDAGSDVPVPEGSDAQRSRTFGEVRAAAVQTLQELAEITGGQSFSARNTAALLDACRNIDRLERASVRSFQYRRYHEGYPWLALGGFLCWITVLTLERTLWRRLP